MAKRVIPTEKPDLSASIDMEVIGKLVHHKRTSIGITLEDAADLCGISKQTYNNVEKGSDNIRVQTLFIVLNALGIWLSIFENEEQVWF